MEGQLKSFIEESSNLRNYHISIWFSWSGRFWEKVNELLVRGIQIQTLKLFFNLELNVDLVLRYLHWVSDGDLKSMWLKWRRYILASCITEILCPEQKVLERRKDCNLIYKLHSPPPLWLFMSRFLIWYLKLCLVQTNQTMCVCNFELPRHLTLK